MSSFLKTKNDKSITIKECKDAIMVEKLSTFLKGKWVLKKIKNFDTMDGEILYVGNAQKELEAFAQKNGYNYTGAWCEYCIYLIK